MIGMLRSRVAVVGSEQDRASAIIEFIFVAVLVLIPLVYLIVAVAVVQRSRLSVTNAARDVGRAIAGSNSQDEAEARSTAALEISLKVQGFSPADVELRYVDPGSSCTAGAITPELSPGSEFAVCVIRHQQLPAVPTVLSGRGVTTVGRFVVHIDEFRIVRR